MKLKYYLRGLGIGIICTAIIMGIALSGNKKETMTDTEIIERARLLGMVMPEDTEDISEEEEPSENKAKNPNRTENREPESKVNDNQEKDSKDEQEQTDKEQDGEQDENPIDNPPQADNNADTVQQTPSQEMVQIEIKPGDYSAAISQTLLQAGLISDAESFNKYLTEKGVDQNLSVGIYQIPAGSTPDQIIDILQKKE